MWAAVSLVVAHGGPRSPSGRRTLTGPGPALRAPRAGRPAPPAIRGLMLRDGCTGALQIGRPGATVPTSWPPALSATPGRRRRWRDGDCGSAARPRPPARQRRRPPPVRRRRRPRRHQQPPFHPLPAACAVAARAPRRAGPRSGSRAGCVGGWSTDAGAGGRAGRSCATPARAVRVRLSALYRKLIFRHSFESPWRGQRGGFVDKLMDLGLPGTRHEWVTCGRGSRRRPSVHQRARRSATWSPTAPGAPGRTPLPGSFTSGSLWTRHGAGRCARARP